MDSVYAWTWSVYSLIEEEGGRRGGKGAKKGGEEGGEEGGEDGGGR